MISPKALPRQLRRMDEAMEYETCNLTQTQDVARDLAARLKPGAVIALSGPMGAGKTAFCGGLAQGLGIEGPVTSPTYTIVNEYQGRLPLFHFDLYRLSDPDEYYAAGLDEFVGGDGVALVEWPQMAELDVSPALTITLERGAGDDERRIEIENDGVAGFDPAALSDWRDADGA